MPKIPLGIGEIVKAAATSLIEKGFESVLIIATAKEGEDGCDMFYSSHGNQYATETAANRWKEKHSLEARWNAIPEPTTEDDDDEDGDKWKKQK